MKPIRDIDPPTGQGYRHGGINAQLAAKDAELARLKGELEAAKRELREWRGIGSTLRLGAVHLLRKLEEAT